jgi:hypothetical protein
MLLTPGYNMTFTSHVWTQTAKSWRACELQDSEPTEKIRIKMNVRRKDKVQVAHAHDIKAYMAVELGHH